MLKNMKVHLLNKYKLIISNVFSLSILQVFNYILPLISVPYLVRVLGPENYGTITFVNAFISYFQIIADYGFNVSATRNISINKNNKEKLNEIFTSVLFIKFILTILGLVSLFIIIFSIDKFENECKVYILSYGMVIGNFLFPIWFFQGMEQMKYITIINTIIKFVHTLLIFVLIKEASDYLVYICLNSFSSILIGIISLFIIFAKFRIKLKMLKLNSIKDELKEGWYIFASSFLTNILTNTGAFILGLFSGKEILGIYGAVDKVVKVLVSIFSPITQAIFPHISEMFKKSFKDGETEVWKFAKVVMPLAAIMCGMALIFDKVIISLLYGSKYDSYSYILKYMTPWMFLSILNNFIGVQYLIGSGNGKFYSRSFVLSATTTLSLYLALIRVISFNGIIVGTIFGELVLTLVMLYYIKKAKKLRSMNYH